MKTASKVVPGPWYSSGWPEKEKLEMQTLWSEIIIEKFQKLTPGYQRLVLNRLAELKK